MGEGGKKKSPSSSRRNGRRQIPHPVQSLHPRYSNIGYGNKLRIDLEASFTPATAGQPFTSRLHERTSPLVPRGWRTRERAELYNHT